MRANKGADVQPFHHRSRPSLIDPPPAATTLQEVERTHILRVLEDTNWVIEGPRGAARVLGLHPNTLRSRLQKLGLRNPRGQV